MLPALSVGRACFLLLFAVLLLSFSQVAAAEENITQLKIEDIAPSVDIGDVLKFSYAVGNMVGPACNAEVDYWVGTKNVRVVEARDTIFLPTGETQGEMSSLLIPDDASGINSFFIQAKCNDSVVMASKPIKVTVPVPVILELSTLDVYVGSEEQPIDFSYTIKSSRTETIPIFVEEFVMKDGNAVWTNSQETFVAMSGSFSGRGPLLPPGNYEVVVRATHQGKTAKIGRNFAIEGSGFSLVPLLSVAGLGFLFFLAAVFTVRFLWVGRKSYSRGLGIPGLRPRGPALDRVVAEQHPESEKLKNYVCLIESECSGPADSVQLAETLEEAGFSKDEKETGLWFAKSVPVRQEVRSGIFVDSFDAVKSETTVTVTVSNNSDSDWRDVIIVSRVPGFLSEAVSEITTHDDLQVVKVNNVVKFTLPRIAAGQSASLAYSIARWIPEEKAKSYPVPAVVNYKVGKESQPMVVELEKKPKKAKTSRESGSELARVKQRQRNRSKRRRRKKK